VRCSNFAKGKGREKLGLLPEKREKEKKGERKKGGRRGRTNRGKKRARGVW